MTRPLSAATHLRLARPSLDLEAARRFYVDGLGLDLLHHSTDDAFAALLMMGLPGAAWHLELTRPHLHPVAPTPTPEDLLVLYLGTVPTPELVARLEEHGGRRVEAANPYWDRWGVTLEDPDGYRLVLCQRDWSH
ncbi:VOC family protein [Deinococcus aerophilus]|uniref:Glyoxalase/bleomycin resistance protein/dioxygenase n=1 Tax=Deinococcus aerophilus TaxID=522488 RepID=A0ABQ2GND5_9DEIO|nr:VOC family protein [Deinococcus aerophilus]GGM03304.1 glyoxalase/bleomycin resistance protein/dioxygenase [Deinococcus aerophilus]